MDRARSTRLFLCVCVCVYLNKGAGNAWAGHKRLMANPELFLRRKPKDSEAKRGALLLVGSNWTHNVNLFKCEFQKDIGGVGRMMGFGDKLPNVLWKI